MISNVEDHMEDCQQDEKEPEEVICVKVTGEQKRLAEDKLY